ncbi:MAG: hypothetical protein M5Z89_09145, partial [Olivibacter sp.]|nr:hypothetical protein [Olivibacter sp. UJ_SKK_5.1]
PESIHFVFGLEKGFGAKPFSFIHYMAVKSAMEINKPKNIFIYYKFEPNGYWWNQVLKEKLASPVLISVPRQIYGNKLYHYAHKSDVIRLMILIEYGGIYLDMDTICIQPLQVFMHHNCVMGREILAGVERGLCNAVIIAAKKSVFLQRWLLSYKYFRSKGTDQFWGEHSIKVPLEIANRHPDIIHIESQKSFFYPSYSEGDLKLLFSDTILFPEAYVFHLWESMSYDRYLANLTPEIVKNVDTSYNLVARKFL